MKTEQRKEIRGRVVSGETEEETGLLTSFQMGGIRAYLYAAGNDPMEQECQRCSRTTASRRAETGSQVQAVASVG